MTEPDDQAVEAVAKALHDFDCYPNCGDTPTTYGLWYRRARAALDAIRRLDPGAFDGAMPEVVGRIAKGENDKIVGWLRGRGLGGLADELERWGA